MKVELNEKAMKILNELRMDSRQTPSSIAKKLGMHHDTVKKYIKYFEDQNIILGYGCSIAYEKISSLYLILFKADPFTAKDYETLKKRIESGELITKSLRVIDSFFAVGEFQAGVLVETESVLELHKYINTILSLYDYLRTYTVLEISRTNQRNLHPNKDWKTLRELVVE